MNAPLRLTADHLDDLSNALTDLSRVTVNRGVTIAPYGRAEVAIAGNVIALSWDESTSQYVIDDRIGS